MYLAAILSLESLATVVRSFPCSRNKDGEQDSDDRASLLGSWPYYDNGKLVSGTMFLLIHIFLPSIAVPLPSHVHMTGLHSLCP